MYFYFFKRKKDCLIESMTNNILYNNYYILKNGDLLFAT